MKASDIIQALYYAVSKGVSYFSNSYSIVNFEDMGAGVYRVTTDVPNFLKVGDFLTMGGLKIPTPIVTATENADDLYFSTYDKDHDLTKTKTETKSVQIFDNFGFQLTLNLLTVPNRYEFTTDKVGFVSFPANPLYMMQEYDFGYNQQHVITSIVSPTQFTIYSDTWLSAPVFEPNYTEAFVRTQYRIGGAIDIDTAVADYTKQNRDAIWLIVILGDAEANKDRNNTNDAYITQGRQMDYYSQIISNFSVYAFIPERGNGLTDTSGRSTRDFVEEVVRPFVFGALLGIDFPTYLACPTQSATSFAGDGYHDYNGAFYIHKFDFQQIMTITNADTAIRETTRAFRDLDLELKNQFSDVTTYTALVNIDEESYTP